MSSNDTPAIRNAEALGALVHNERFRQWIARRDNLPFTSHATVTAHIADTYITARDGELRTGTLLANWATYCVLGA